MSRKILVTQALDERDLLVKKISEKINKSSFVDTIRVNQETVGAKHVSKEDFTREAEEAYQQIMEMIEQYEKLDAAIMKSNANTTIETSYGTFSVAAAIALRGRLRGTGLYEGEADFERKLQEKMQSQYREHSRIVDTKNGQLDVTAEGMRLSILGKDTKVKDDKPLGVVDAYVKENKTELVDPLKVTKKIDALAEKRVTLLAEIDTQIKVSNATTFIEID